MADSSTLEAEPVEAKQRSFPIEQVYRGGGKAGRLIRPAPKVLRDMRLIYERPAAAKTPGQQALKKLFETDPKLFIRELSSLERAHSSIFAAQHRAPHDDARQSPTSSTPTAA